MSAVHVHATVFKRARGSLVWFEGNICLEEIDGHGRMPTFLFCASRLESDKYYFFFTEENVVLCWLNQHAQARARRIANFLTSCATQLMQPLLELPDGSNASYAWGCDPGADEEIAMLEDALNCIPVAHTFRRQPEIAQA